MLSANRMKWFWSLVRVQNCRVSPSFAVTPEGSMIVFSCCLLFFFFLSCW